MEWKFVESTTKENIEKVEKELGYNFPDDFKECVLKNNHGTPEIITFYLFDGTQKVFGSLLSFNETDDDYIMDFNKTTDNVNFIAIALDPFGNKIAYEKTTNEIIYINHETNEISIIAKNWKSFEESLSDLKKANYDEGK